MTLCFASSLGVPLRPRFGTASRCGALPRHVAQQRRRLRAAYATSETPAPAAAADVEEPATAAEEAPAAPTTVTRVVPTNGGFMVDCNVFHRHKKTRHTVVIGQETIDELCDGLSGTVDAKTVVECLFDFFIEKRHDITNTEGLQDSGVFPINYFSLRQVFYIYPEAREYLSGAFARHIAGDN